MEKNLDQITQSIHHQFEGCLKFAEEFGFSENEKNNIIKVKNAFLKAYKGAKITPSISVSEYSTLCLEWQKLKSYPDVLIELSDLENSNATLETEGDPFDVTSSAAWSNYLSNFTEELWK